MYIDANPSIVPPQEIPEIQSVINTMHERSDAFGTSIKGKKLEYLKPLADDKKNDVQCLEFVFDKQGKRAFLRTNIGYINRYFRGT